MNTDEEIINIALKESLIRSPLYLQRYIKHKYNKSIPIKIININCKTHIVIIIVKIAIKWFLL